MKDTTLNVFLAAVVASLVAGAASAQTDTFSGTGLIGDSAVESANEDLADDIEDDFERDLDRFGNEGRAIGFDGSLALRGAATSGNDETAVLGIGANIGYFDGANGYELSLSYRYTESENDDGDTETDEDRLLYDFQYTRDFNPDLYGFVKLQGSYNGDDDSGDDVERENDVFLGLGLGYRVINTADLQWSLQAGPGYRFADFSNIDDAILDGDLLEGEGDDISEAALAISSNYFNRINPTVFVTNDTDIIASESDTVVFNDLGLNVAMGDQLALRTSIVTEYHTDPLPTEESTDNTFGVSLVYNLN